VAGRAILRTILGGYLDRKPRELAFLHGAQGKPRLALKHWMDSLHFNVSHTDSLALYAVARGGEVGVDIERVRDVPDWSDIADIFFAPWEQDGLRDLPDERRRLAFLQAWTRREALLKTSGAGLAGENDGCLTAREDGFPVHSLIPEPGYLAAVACAFPAPRMTFFTRTEAAGPGRTITFATQNNLT
jgi:4'-phosphopantetheinyl transferase